MTTLLEIYGDDIANLNDTDLRRLIGLLCEADYRLAGLPTKGILWGGDQSAADGGLDVVIDDDVIPPSYSPICRKHVGFQVKNSDMPRSKIIEEMRPKGKVRDSIKELIKEEGAYIIVSSSGSTSHSALLNRNKAMKEAIDNEKNHNLLHLEFFDRGRVATWVRSHPSLGLWVRNKIDNPLQGWRTYDNWSNAPGGIDEEYILDDEFRLLDYKSPIENGLSITDGLEILRRELSVPSTSVRLAGLSGVGKTRFIQALFDDRIGKDTLNPTQVIYADISDGPIPDPCSLAGQLINDKSKVILIIDNCPPDLHQRLTKLCTTPDSTLSLLTVEYDVRDDIPEETNVYRLQPASIKTIEKLIDNRYPDISQIDIQTIADFSGGNARLAIALAGTLKHGETLSGFRNDELFQRLFWQRHDRSESLLISAEACSLVYSFEGTKINGKESEMPFLASLVNKTPTELYRDVNELKTRDLIQSRNVWRAVLPQAIANRLAKQAIETIPKEIITKGFLGCGSERLIRSFSKRLSYLHDSEIAREIAHDWLIPEGFIGRSIENLNQFGLDILSNIAPISPGKTLELIEFAASGPRGEEFTSRNNINFYKFARLLRHLAYDSNFFTRSVNLLCRFALSESKDENSNSIRKVLQSLFYIQLSGTHAPVNTRAEIVIHLLYSNDDSKQELGLELLNASLESWHFSSLHGFDFGARPRDYGYYPKTREELNNWFQTYIDICTNLILEGRAVSNRVMHILSNHFRGLWTIAHMSDALVKAAKLIHSQSAWNDGWLAIRSVIRFDKNRISTDELEKINKLDELLKPDNLIDQVKLYALSDSNRYFDLEDDYNVEFDASNAWKRLEQTTRKIGFQVGQSPRVLEILLPELVSTYSHRMQIFGEGIAEGTDDKLKLYETLKNQLRKTSADKRRVDIFMGFISFCAENEPELTNVILDDILIDDVLSKWFPWLQASATSDYQAIKRFNDALDRNTSPIEYFEQLATRRKKFNLSDNEIIPILHKILKKHGGNSVVIEILNRRIHQLKDKEKTSRDLMDISRKALSSHNFDNGPRSRGNRDYELSKIAESCLKGKKGVAASKKLSEKLAESITDYRIYAFDYPTLLNVLAELQPVIFLDSFIIDMDMAELRGISIFTHNNHNRSNPLNLISDKTILSWCAIDPEPRYPAIASILDTFRGNDETHELEWKPIVHKLISEAPNLKLVLEGLSMSIYPSSYQGSIANVHEKRLPLFESLQKHNNPNIAKWAKARFVALLKQIEKEREWEKGHFSDRDERFE